jgi:hypothetical protein
MPGRSLLFVYNADHETLPMKNDMIRTVIPGKEACNLLALTFSPVGMKKEWRRFTQSLGIPARFLARDEFAAEFRTVQSTFPAAFLQDGKDLFIFLSTEEINRCKGIEDLMSLVQQRLIESSGRQE